LLSHPRDLSSILVLHTSIATSFPHARVSYQSMSCVPYNRRRTHRSQKA
jgi:hypothetical protein